MRAAPVLRAVDVQRGFVNAHTEHVPALVEAAHAVYGTAAAARFRNKPAPPFRRLLGRNRMGPGDPDHAPAFHPKEGARIVEKTGYTAVNDALLALLQRRPGAPVHVCGIETDACVLKTALDLFDAGFEPLVLADLCGSMSGADAREEAPRVLERTIGPERILRGFRPGKGEPQ